MIRIVSEKSEAELARERAERERASAEFDARYAARELTANLIRIHRGAGKPYELGRQLTELVKAMQAHWDAAKYWPYNEIADELRIEDDRDWMAGPKATRSTFTMRSVRSSTAPSKSPRRACWVSVPRKLQASTRCIRA